MKKKLGFALALAIVSSGVLAEWEEVGHSVDLTMYVDRATIRKSGTKVKMWDLRDYKEIVDLKNLESYWSIKNQTEYDCKQEKYRSLHFSLYGGKMGSEQVIYASNSIEDWSPIPPKSLVESSWKAACRVK